jgi:hypothetical protein
MYISFTNSSTNGFKKCANANRPGNADNDELGETAPVTIAEPPHEDREVIEEPPQHS